MLGDPPLRIAPAPTFMAAMLVWAEAIERKDPHTSGHVSRVAHYSMLLGSALRLPREELADLWLAAALHDVGKIFVSDAILGKPGPLTPDETATMQAHPVTGALIVAGVRDLHGAHDGVRYHHERYDGWGYPDGLQGTEIPLQARIIAVADAYDVITTRRPYRDASSPSKAACEISAGAGTHFCPSTVRAFQNLFAAGCFTHSARKPPQLHDFTFAIALHPLRETPYALWTSSPGATGPGVTA